MRPTSIATHSLVTALFIISSLCPSICCGATGNGLHTADDVSVFHDIKLPDGSNTIAKMETLWEMDMSQAGDGDGSNDANQDNHNLLMVNGQLYVYIEHGMPTPKYMHIRRFDINGGELPNLTSPFPTNAYPRMLLSDDYDKLALVTIEDNSGKTDAMKIEAYVYDVDLNLLKTYEFLLDNHYVKQDCEWLGLHGNLMEGDFGFSIGCWHCSGADAVPDRVFYPSKCDFAITDGKNVELTVTHYDSGTSPLETRKYNELKEKSGCGGMLYVTVTDDGKHIVQSYAKDKATPHVAHSPLLIYDYNEEMSMVQSDHMKDAAFLPSDRHCFGVFPVKIGGEQLLVLPYKFNPSEGVKFKVTHWDGDHSSFSKLTELWQFPEKTFPADCSAVFGTNNANIYDYARPKVVIVPSNASRPEANATYDSTQESGVAQEATVYAYMPGALLGAYKISVDNNATPSNIISRPASDKIQIDFNCQNQIVEISSTVNERLTVALYDVSGVVSYLATLPPESALQIDMDTYAPGLYLLRVNDRFEKIIFR